MVCPNCNSQYNDNLTACPFCSAVQQAPAQAPVQQTPFQVPQGTTFAPPAPVKKKSKAGIIIPIVIAAIFVILSIASAIMNNKESTHVMVFEETEKYYDCTDEYTFYCKGDNVYKMQEVITFEYKDIYEEYMEEEAEIISDAIEDEFGGYDFIDISHKLEGTTITVTIVYSDIEENMDEYIDLGIIEEGTEILSYEKTRENFEDDGFELKDE